MAVETLYAFLEDEALHTHVSLDLTEAYNQGYGVLSGETRAYLVKPGQYNDIRHNRLTILNGTHPKGELRLLFDQNRFDIDKLRTLTDVENVLLINILERLYLCQSYNDAQIEAILTSNSVYRGYIAGSLAHGETPHTVLICDGNNNYTEITVYDWYSFEFEMEEVRFVLKFWISQEAFKTDYPYTTITRVIPPYSPSDLVSPAKLYQSGNLKILTASSNFIFQQSDIETAARDQNGIYTYITKYVVNSNNTIQLPFALPYCGPRVPTGLESRRAIREYLEANTELTKDQFFQIFPELYVASRFFIIPLWDVYQARSDRDVYPSILKYRTLLSKIPILLPSYDQEFIETYMEFLLNAQNKLWSIVIPDEVNETYFSILDQHPTYQEYSSQVAGWRYMTAETQEFAGKLCRAFAVLQGEMVSDEFYESQMGSMDFLTFTAGESEYLLLKPESYNVIMGV